MSPSRVNITLDFANEQQRQKKELPHKLLVLSDFTQSMPTLPVALRPRISVNKNNFNQVLAQLQPQLVLTVTEGNDVRKVRLRFHSLQDFSPTAIAQQVPSLRNLQAMRHLLKEFKAQLLDNPALRRELAQLLQARERRNALQKELQQCAALAYEE